MTIIVLYAVVNIFMNAFLIQRNSNKSEGSKHVVIKFNDNCKVIIKLNSLADHKRWRTPAGYSPSDYGQTVLQYTLDINVQGYPDRYRSGLCLDHKNLTVPSGFSSSDYGLENPDDIVRVFYSLIRPWKVADARRVCLHLIMVRSEDDPYGTTSTNSNRAWKGGGRPPVFHHLIMV